MVLLKPENTGWLILKLNHEIHEQEVKAGLHKKGKTKKKKSKNKQKADASEQMKLF